MKKTFKISLLILIVFALINTFCACDEKNDDIDAVLESEAVEIKATLSEISEKVYEYIENADMDVSDSKKVENTISDMYNSDKTAQEIFEYLKENGLCSKKLKNGIIVGRYINGTNYTYKSTGKYKCTTFTVELDVINPETGAWSKYKTFTSEDTHSCSAFYNGNRLSFNNDYTKMTAVCTTENEEKHVGWIDENGQFTDVTKMITKQDGFETSIVKHGQPCFSADGYFFFEQQIGHKVPVNNLTPEAVLQLSRDEKDVSKYIRNPNGSLQTYGVGIETIHYFYDESMNSEVGSYGVTGNFVGWASPSTFISGTESKLYRWVMKKMDNGRYCYNGSDIFKRNSSEYERTDLFNSGNGRTCTSYKMSPDKSEVSFLSRLTTGADQAWYLYKVSVGGGEPVKISTDYKFDDNCKIIDWN